MKGDYVESFNKMVRNLREEGYFDRNADEDDNQTDSVGAFETAVDWTSNFGAARNQKSCGSCWAFSTLGMVEGRISQKTGTITPYLSTQQLVDCDTVDKGCNGGWFSNALKYVLANGVVKDSDYPYTAVKATTCKVPTTAPRTKISKFDYCTNTIGTYACTEDKVFTRLTTGSQAIAIDGSVIQSYRSGVFTGSCTTMNHGVVLVGAGTDATTGLQYWKVRNSWGTWGENGYIRVGRNLANNSNCFITKHAFSITP